MKISRVNKKYIKNIQKTESIIICAMCKIYIEKYVRFLIF